MKSVLLFSFFCAALGLSAASYHEPWRPQFHFSPATNWMNDPNGMLYFEGEYHLFYQYNPFGNNWGHMSWGHAVSRDLVRWKHLPVALLEENNVMIFSGSAVVDRKNTSGFGIHGKPPLVAIYTGHHTDRPLQNQHIAYSNDRGRTWTKYSGNPVLDIGEKDFRDPKVFWHDATGRWVMAVSWPTERKVRFYTSPDLKTWAHASDFGPAGSTTGIWECPDLFPVRLEGAGNRNKWVLIVNVGSGAPAGGSGCQYFVGEFDGTRFQSETSSPLWADHGADFYAAVSWSDVPKSDGRRLWIGWMSNWRYANDVPTSPWRSAMSVPRELLLRSSSQGWRLLQIPVRELKGLGKREHRLRNKSFEQTAGWLNSRKLGSELLDVEMSLTPNSPPAGFSIAIDSDPSESTLITVQPSGQLVVDRRNSGNTAFHKDFSAQHETPPVAGGTIQSLRLLIDTGSVEIFANNGEAVVTDLVLPRGGNRRLRLISQGKGPQVDSMRVSELRTAW